jgi:hypothetical protein
MLLALLLTLAPQATATDAAYRRVVAGALARAQESLAASADFAIDHSRWDDPWVLRSEHYEVRTTKSYAQARTLSKNLEYMYGEFEKLLGQTPPRAEPYRVWVFPDLAAYNQFGNQNGAEHSSLLGSFFSSGHAERPVVTYQSANATLLGMWITHAAVHQYLETTRGTRALVWVSEGLASYFALYWDWSYGARELERIERSDFVPLERLFAEPLSAYLHNPDDRFLQLGMLFHFLLNSCEGTKNGAAGDPASGPFQEYLRLAVRGQDTRETDFEQSLEGTLELLEEEFKAHEFDGQ